MPFALRRVHHRHLIPNSDIITLARGAVERWKPFVEHPHVVALREIFVSADVMERAALFFAHDFYAGASSLEEIHCSKGGHCASEQDIWAYATQICSFLRSVHSAGIAAGGSSALNPSKVLLCPTVLSSCSENFSEPRRLRIAAVGVADVLHPKLAGDQTIRFAQREDLVAAGQLLAILACGPTTKYTCLDPVAEAMKRCSRTLGNLISALTTASITDCATYSHLLSSAAFNTLEVELSHCDRLQAELSREANSGRLFRLLVKISFIKESSAENDNWAETGERYILKLFQDYMFQHHNGEGTHLVDWGHIFESLNKVDIGVAEKVLLLSRDEMSMLVISYADIKRCLERTYAELMHRSQAY